MQFCFVMTRPKYRPSDVNRLVKQLQQYFPEASYTCYTDQPFSTELSADIHRISIDPARCLSGVWNKLIMFHPTIGLRGDVIYVDLDTYIRSHPTFFNDPSLDFNRLWVVNCWWKPYSIVRLTNYDVTFNSSLMAWNLDKQPTLTQLWTHFEQSGLRDYFVKKYAGIDRYMAHEPFEGIRWDSWPSSLIGSYKYEPDNTWSEIVTFEEVDFASVDLKSLAETR